MHLLCTKDGKNPGVHHPDLSAYLCTTTHMLKKLLGTTMTIMYMYVVKAYIHLLISLIEINDY